MDTFWGIPAHPLLVHIPVVLVPLCAIGVIAMAAHRGIFQRLRWIILGLAAVSTVATFMASEAGESLERSVERTALVKTHAEAGDQFQAIMVLFFLVVAAMVGWDWLMQRGGKDANETRSVTLGNYRSQISILTRVAGVIAAIVASYFVIDVGHSGAKSVWDETKITTETERGGTPSGDSDDK